MDAEVREFLDKWAAKSEAKAAVMTALGEAKLAEFDKRDGDAAHYWSIVEKRGVNGDEGRAYADAYAIAEAYVKEHAEFFAPFEQFVNPDDHNALVTLIGAYRHMGREEDVARLTMFELVKFERQNIGQAVKVVVKRGS